MRKKKVYLFEFHKSQKEMYWEWHNISETDQEKIRNVEFDAFQEYEDTFGNYNILVITTELEKISCEKILKENLIHYLCKDFSENILRGNLKISPTNELFQSKLEQWVLENLNIDFILDLINEKGITSLNSHHREFLKRI